MRCWNWSSSENGARSERDDDCEAERKVKEIRERVRRPKLSMNWL